MNPRLTSTLSKLWKKCGSPSYLAAACASLLTAGCGTVENTGPSDRFMVTSAQAQFFKYGPAQAFGPDFTLAKGQRVTMLNREYGYSKVKMEDGTIGYMATDELKLAPPDPPAPRVAGVTGGDGWFTGKPKRSNVLPTPADPLFDVNDVPLPMPETTEPAPAESTPPAEPDGSGDASKPDFLTEKPLPSFR